MLGKPDSPWNPAIPVDISPEQFEHEVLDWIRKSANEQGLPCKVTHREMVTGTGGAYAIDVVVELLLLGGARLLVLIECKHQRRPVERDEVIVLEGKLRAVGGHKGMLASSSGYQSGAIKYAAVHGIATVTVVAGAWLFETKGTGSPSPPPPWARIGRFAGVRVLPIENGFTSHAIDGDQVDTLSEWLAGGDG